MKREEQEGGRSDWSTRPLMRRNIQLKVDTVNIPSLFPLICRRSMLATRRAILTV